MTMLKRLTFLLIFLHPICAANFSTAVIKDVRKGVVSITTRVLRSAYDTAQESYGSGFIADKKNGYIITNRHVVSIGSLTKHEVTFHNGKQVDAHIYYYDPIYDLAVLKVNPADIPSSSRQLKLNPNGAERDVEVFLIGKNSGQDFSFQTGRISSMDETDGHILCQAMRISVNTQGGSSGSAVCDATGQVVGLNHSGTPDSYALALWSGYIRPVLQQIQSGEGFSRKSTGAVLDYYYLDRAVKYLNLSPQIAKDLAEKFPHSQSKVVVVRRTLEGSPAAKILRPGDLLLQVNGKDIGSNLWVVEKEYSNSKGSVSFTLIRYGKRLTVRVDLYDVGKSQITRLLYFAGGVFYESDELLRARLGVMPGTLLLSNVQPGSGLHQKFASVEIGGKSMQYSEITKINDTQISSLDDLIKFVRTLKAGDRFAITYKAHNIWVGYNSEIGNAKPTIAAEGDVHQSDGPPLLHTLDASTQQWKTTPLWAMN